MQSLPTLIGKEPIFGNKLLSESFINYLSSVNQEESEYQTFLKYIQTTKINFESCDPFAPMYCKAGGKCNA